MASAMTDSVQILRDALDDLAIIQGELERLTFENGALRERLRLSEEINYSDDLADARRDRERDLEFSRSEDFQARGEG